MNPSSDALSALDTVLSGMIALLFSSGAITTLALISAYE
jgi:hypothetical protein